MNTIPATRRCWRRPNRNGTATVELAVCLPALALLVFGSMQACDMIYLKHSLTTATYEGSLEVARKDSTDASVQARVEQVLDIRGVKKGVCVLTSVSPIEELNPGDEVRLLVRAPVAPNLKFNSFFGAPKQLRVRFDCTR